MKAWPKINLSFQNLLLWDILLWNKDQWITEAKILNKFWQVIYTVTVDFIEKFMALMTRQEYKERVIKYMGRFTSSVLFALEYGMCEVL